MKLLRIQTGDCPQESVASLVERFREVRLQTLKLCEPLKPDDFGIQSMPDVSPPKWHLAHTTWFFETFLLIRHDPDYRPFDPAFAHLFNSYYKALGSHHPRNERGLLSRPTLEEVLEYRIRVDAAMTRWLAEVGEGLTPEQRFALNLGCHHEEQHQELLLTDILHIFSCNPLKPVYSAAAPALRRPTELDWKDYPEALVEIGHAGEGFCFDNERPRHRVFLEAFRLASRPVSNGEFLQFVEDGAYVEPRFWLSDAWDLVQSEGWKAPLYWAGKSGERQTMSLQGLRALDYDAPVSHLSYYEADAYARWAGKRLPSEAEWESAAPSERGEVWEWTRSPYSPYPGFQAMAGNFAEYNGKFMCNQMVLRGGSRFTPRGHARLTYRNFFPPSARWQCSGFRLAEDL